MKKKVTMPKELRLVVKVKAKPGYQIECTFDNEVVKSYDMSFVTKKSGSMLVPFKNESFFVPSKNEIIEFMLSIVKFVYFTIPSIPKFNISPRIRRFLAPL